MSGLLRASSMVLGSLALVSCSREPSAAERKAADDRAVAQVEAAQKQKPPPKPIAPEPILFADIQKFNLYGAGCAFAPGGSMGAVLLTREKVGYIKLDGGMMRFAADPGSAELPMGTHARYVGKALAASLTRSDGNGTGEGLRFPAHLTVTDPTDQVVYDEDGDVQCGA